MDELRDTQYNLPIGTDCISRRKLLDKFEPWLEVHDYNDGERNVIKAVLYEIKCMPPATDTNAGTKLGTNLAEVGTDLISRKQAIDMCRKPRMRNADCSDFEMEIMMLPSAEPKRGKWIRDGHHIQCDRCEIWMCDTDREGDPLPRSFCPNCGAKMEETNNG